MLNDIEKSKVREAVAKGLDRAVANWDQVGSAMLRRSIAMDSVIEAHVEPSKIPGHQIVSDAEPKVDEFVAVMVDMRKSSERLKTRLTTAKIQDGIQRIYYETSALLPAVAMTASFKNGVVTEYLGDGALVLFPVDKNDRHTSVRSAYRAAANCVGDTRQIINDELSERFALPRIDIGAGLSMSRALVTLVGVEGNLQPKAIGVCVWEASKLSGGHNYVMVSEDVRKAWHSTENGKLRFREEIMKGIKGFRVVT